MERLFIVLLVAGCSLSPVLARVGSFAQSAPQPAAPSAEFSADAAARFASLALACVHKEYPNKIGHSMASDADVAPPRKLTPAFYGCYDWHSSVHGHWLLARVARTWPDAPFAAAARAALAESLTPEHMRDEVAYLNAAGRQSFERPYGLAWLMLLGAELREWGKQDTQARVLATTLKPLEDAAQARFSEWLPKLAHPIRIGEHAQTAFSFGLLLDSARQAGDKPFAALLVSKAREFYLADRNCPMQYEPSGEDFLSPCLAEADLMRRVLGPAEFARWLTVFLPTIPNQRVISTHAAWLKPEVVTDPSDPKLAHLDGLNLSRAWMLEGIAAGLPSQDARVPALRAVAAAHRRAGLAAVTGAHYEGGHWLGSFAVYLVTARGSNAK